METVWACRRTQCYRCLISSTRSLSIVIYIQTEKVEFIWTGWSKQHSLLYENSQKLPSGRKCHKQSHGKQKAAPWVKVSTVPCLFWWFGIVSDMCLCVNYGSISWRCFDADAVSAAVSTSWSADVITCINTIVIVSRYRHTIQLGPIQLQANG